MLNDDMSDLAEFATEVLSIWDRKPFHRHSAASKPVLCPVALSKNWDIASHLHQLHK